MSKKTLSESDICVKYIMRACKTGGGSAAKVHSSLLNRSISPHSIRHTTAMHLGVDFSVIALWLGHESTNTTHRYVEADLTMKGKALARLQEPDTKMDRYHPSDDALIQFLQSL